MATASKSLPKKARKPRSTRKQIVKQIDCERLVIRDADGNPRIVLSMIPAARGEAMVPAISLVHDNKTRCDMRLLDNGEALVNCYGPGPEQQALASMAGMMGHGFIHLVGAENACCDPGEIYINASGPSICVEGRDPKIVCKDAGGQDVFDATEPAPNVTASQYRVAVMKPEHDFEPTEATSLPRAGEFIEFISDEYEDSMEGAIRRAEGYNSRILETRKGKKQPERWAVMIPPGAPVGRGRYDRRLIMQGGCYSHH